MMDGLIWLHNQAGLALRDATQQIATLTDENASQAEELAQLREQVAVLGQQLSDAAARS